MIKTELTEILKSFKNDDISIQEANNKILMLLGNEDEVQQFYTTSLVNVRVGDHVKYVKDYKLAKNFTVGKKYVVLKIGGYMNNGQMQIRNDKGRATWVSMSNCYGTWKTIR